jgi:hypothetical protein
MITCASRRVQIRFFVTRLWLVTNRVPGNAQRITDTPLKVAAGRLDMGHRLAPSQLPHDVQTRRRSCAPQALLPCSTFMPKRALGSPILSPQVASNHVAARHRVPRDCSHQKRWCNQYREFRFESVAVMLLRFCDRLLCGVKRPPRSPSRRASRNGQKRPLAGHVSVS